ncbi:MAG: amidohydrolase [Pirellulales bacterium]
MSARFAIGMVVPSTAAARRAQAAETERSPSPVIDTHMHVWSDHPRRFPFVHPYHPDFKEPPTRATVEMLLEDMDQNGVTHAILVQVIYHGWDNRYVAECVRRYSRVTPAASDGRSALQRDPVVKPVRQDHGSRFRGHGLIDPTDPAAAEKLEYWVREQGLSGMRLSPIYYQGRDEWLNSRASQALWKKAEELGPVFNLFIAAEQLPKLQQMVERFPAVPVLIDHLAYVRADAPPEELDKLLALARCPNVSVKVSELQSISPQKTYPYRDTYTVVERVYDAFGPDRLLWGTGFPGAARAHYDRPTLKQELDLIRKHIPFFTAEDKRKILGLNAARIWKIKA